jgi:hypothetical protein
MMLALTVKQPWADAIIHAQKDIENRTWPTAYRGPLAIHAGKSYDEGGRLFMLRHNLYVPDDLVSGAIIGVVDLIDCTHTTSDSRWAEPGVWHWRLANPRAVEPVFVRGQQGLFTVTVPRLEV